LLDVEFSHQLNFGKKKKIDAISIFFQAL